MRSTRHRHLFRSARSPVRVLFSSAALLAISLAHSAARPPIHSDVSTATTVISREQVSQVETGSNGLREAIREIKYQNDHMASISSQYFGQSQDKPDTTTLETFDPQGRLTGFDFRPRTGSPFHETFDYSSVLNPGDLPKITLSQLTPNASTLTPNWFKDSKVIAMPDKLPEGLQPYLSVVTPQFGSVVYPGTKDGATFSTLPILPGAPVTVDTGLLVRGFHPSTGGQDITRCNLWLGGRSVPLSGTSIHMQPPATAGSYVPFAITNPDGSPLAIGAFPSVPGGRLTPDRDTPMPQVPGFWLPTVGQAGRPVTIYGPFDGDSANTRVTFNGDVLPIFQETVDSAVVTLQNDIFGTTNLHVYEGGHDIKVSHTNIGIRLSDDGRILMPGETGPVDVKVMGLEHITKPVTLTLVNLDPDIVSMNGGNFQRFDIAPGSGDTLTRNYSVVGIKRGAADIVGRVPQIWTLTDTPLSPGDSHDGNRPDDVKKPL